MLKITKFHLLALTALILGLMIAPAYTQDAPITDAPAPIIDVPSVDPIAPAVVAPVIEIAPIAPVAIEMPEITIAEPQAAEFAVTDASQLPLDLTPANAEMESFGVKSGIPTLSSELNELLSGVRYSDDATYINVEFDARERVKVMIITLDEFSAQSIMATLPSLGAEVIVNYMTWIDAWVPVNQLGVVAQLSGVSVVQTPIQVFPVPTETPLPDVLPIIMPESVASNVPYNRPPELALGGVPELAATINYVWRDRCVLNIAFTAQQQGNYGLEIWDNGVKLFDITRTLGAGRRPTFTYTMTEPSTDGTYGIYAIDRGTNTTIATIDPYVVPFDAMLACANVIRSQGSGASAARRWQNNGWMGQGVKVLVLDSFMNYVAAQNTGELPPNIATLGTLNFSSPHGTAVAEIIYDMAPGVDFTFASPSSATDMANRISTQSSSHDIISSSMGFYNAESGDGMGVMMGAINTARNNGALFVQAAGNQARYNWQQAFTDVDGDKFHEFAPGVELNLLNNGYSLPSGAVIFLYMRWNAWPTTNQDYDLYLYRWNGTAWAVVASSTGSQTGTQPPTEAIGVQLTQSGYYSVAMTRYSSGSGSHVLDLMGHNAPNFTYSTASRSLVDPATPVQAFGVAAINAVDPYNLESYSSAGPALGAGGSLQVGNAQPRIAGYANVDTFAYGPGIFNGTSAATPHVSGAAALVLSAYPNYTPGQLASFLESIAIDMGAVGYDYRYGVGRLTVGPAPLLSVPSITAPAHRSFTSDNTPTFTWSTSSGAGMYDFQLSNVSDFSYLITTASRTVTNFTPSALPDGRYYARVRAQTAIGNGGTWSNFSVVNVDTVAPAAPPLNRPGNGVILGRARPKFIWTAVPGATRYWIQVDNNSNFASPEINVGNITLTEFTPGFDLPGGTHYWRVWAYDNANNFSSPSVSRSFTIVLP